MPSTAQTVVLVIEDEPSIRQLLTEVLSDEGYHVVAAATGDEALGILRTMRPDLITLDLNLPDLAGEWVLTKLHERFDGHSPPVIIISAKPTIAPEMRTMAAAIVSKPFELRWLLSVVYKLMPPPPRVRAGEAALEEPSC
jgi:two-component system OmpR family response regulator